MTQNNLFHCTLLILNSIQIKYYPPFTIIRTIISHLCYIYAANKELFCANTGSTPALFS